MTVVFAARARKDGSFVGLGQVDKAVTEGLHQSTGTAKDDDIYSFAT